MPIETDSHIVSPRDKDVKFGAYSPSVGGRPTTAPNKRSVRFADELGFDDLDASQNESRPSSAPGGSRRRKAPTGGKRRDFEASSSFEDDTTDCSQELKHSPIKSSSPEKTKPRANPGKEINTETNDPKNG